MKRIITFITLLCLLTAPVMAQATYQSLFAEGKNLYSKAKKQWTNRNADYKTTCTQAINKFKLAKNKTKNQVEIQSCNKWIGQCQALQKKALPSPPKPDSDGKAPVNEANIPDWRAITITGLTFATSDEEGNLTSSYGDRLYSNLQYVKAKVSFRNNVRESRDHIDIKVKIYKPDGTLDGSNGSYTFEDYLRADGNYKSDDFDYTVGWGNKSGKSYKPGTYRYEIWIGTHKMYSTNFTVYQANSGSGLDNDNSSAARGMSDSHWRTVLKYCVENPTRRYSEHSYKGTILNDRRNKYGAYYYGDEDGDFYFGQWENGERSGVGLYVAGPDRHISIGESEDALIYVGRFSNSSRANQKGTLYNKHGKLTYYGEFDADGKPKENYPSSGNWGEFKFECISYTDGSYYIGETYKGDRHGFGVFVWKDKSFWMGNWSYGKRSGAGSYIKYNGTIQTGTWDGDEYTASSGSGSSSSGGSSSSARGMNNDSWRTVLERCFENPSRTFSGDPYKGGLYNNDCQNFGAYQWKSSGAMYFGKWDNGERNGYGLHICGIDKCMYSGKNDAEIYVGNYSNGRIADGKGTIYDTQGNLKYFGTFENGQPTENYPTSGDWDRFKFECISYTDGSYYIGETIDGKREGFGVFVWKNKDYWMGFWDDGERKGSGMYIYYNGNVLTGRWDGDTHTE